MMHPTGSVAPSPTARMWSLVGEGSDDALREELSRHPDVDLEVRRSWIRMDDVQMFTLLHRAVVAHRLDHVTTLLNAGAQVDTLDMNERTALQIAVGVGDVAIAQRLLEAGANVHHRSVDGRRGVLVTALDSALDDDETGQPINRFPCFCLLLDHGVNPSRADDGQAPLHRMATMADPRFLDEALRRGADPNLKSVDGKSLLYTAAQEDRSQGAANVRSLLNAGADINVKFEGETPLIAALMRSNAPAVKMLLEAGADRSLEENGKPTLLANVLSGLRKMRWHNNASRAQETYDVYKAFEVAWERQELNQKTTKVLPQQNIKHCVGKRL